LGAVFSLWIGLGALSTPPHSGKQLSPKGIQPFQKQLKTLSTTRPIKKEKGEVKMRGGGIVEEDLAALRKKNEKRTAPIAPENGGEGDKQKRRAPNLFRRPSIGGCSRA